jgi:O-antigen/teichoic acid export membrane protein
MRIIDQLPVWFLTIMVGDVAVGAYSAARAAYLLLFSFFNSVEMTLFPLVSEQAPTHPDRLRVVLGQARKYSLWLGLLVASLVTVTAPWLVRIIAGDEHLAAVPLLQLLVWGLVVHALAQSQRPILYAIGEQRVQFAAYLLSMALEAGMLYVAIRWLGVEGAVWAILASNLAVVAVRQAVIHRIAPGLSELPGNLFAIEASDRELWQDLRESFGTRRGR